MATFDVVRMAATDLGLGPEAARGCLAAFFRYLRGRMTAEGFQRVTEALPAAEPLSRGWEQAGEGDIDVLLGGGEESGLPHVGDHLASLVASLVSQGLAPRTAGRVLEWLCGMLENVLGPDICDEVMTVVPELEEMQPESYRLIHDLRS